MTVLFQPVPLRTLACQEAAGLVTRSLEGALSLREEARYHIHLGLCSHCRAYMKQLTLVQEAVVLLSKQFPSPANRLRLRQHFSRCHPPHAVMR